MSGEGSEEGFSADWLALRVGADTRARDPGLAGLLTRHFAGREALRVVDLGSGTGANLRATAPLIQARQHWVLTDFDAALLARAAPVPPATIETRRIDLSAGLGPLLDPAPDLVTASAFLDLCGAEWLDALAGALTRARAVLYTVLSYDGRETWAPPHPLDAAVLAAFHADQRRDKGLGPSLGPGAHACLADRLRGLGWQVHEAPSDWTLEQPRDAALIGALAEGSADAAARTMGAKAAEWRAARAGAERVLIGHKDLLALPPQ